jgi:LytS/YehU family sensor histidine kinase
MTIMRHFDAGGRGEHSVLPMMVRDVAMVTLTMALGVAVKTTERIRQIEESRRTDELKHLKSQLNPHFLFNSLNTIYALTGLNADRARDAIHKLSRLLRYTLYEAEAPMVPLQRDLDFVADYVRLMEMRIGSAMKITMTLDAASRSDAQIAPMLFVSLIENAFKHGNTGLPDAFVDINIKADDRHGITCHIVNSVAHATAAADLPVQSAEPQSGGVGLVNLRRRLQLIYADKAHLNIKQDDATFTADLTLNI